MIKPSLFLTLLLVIGLSTAIYGVENRVQTLHKELSHMQRDIVNDRNDLHVLQAEWSYLSRPERIATLAETHLQIDTVKPNHIIQIGQIDLENTDENPFTILQEYTLSSRN